MNESEKFFLSFFLFYLSDNFSFSSSSIFDFRAVILYFIQSNQFFLSLLLLLSNHLRYSFLSSFFSLSCLTNFFSN